MTNIYLHGGPGLQDYMPRFFPESPNTVFCPQKNPAANMTELTQPLRDAVQAQTDFTIIAHSFGGVIALEYLRTSIAQKPKALVLMGVPIYYGCEREFAEECTRRNFAAPTTEDVFLSPKEKAIPECKQTLTEIFATFDPRTLQKIGPSYLTRFDFRDFLNKIEIPTLILYGTEDVRVPARAQKNYGGQNPLIQHVAIQDAGHFTFIEKTNAMVIQDLIQKFVNSI